MFVHVTAWACLGRRRLRGAVGRGEGGGGRGGKQSLWFTVRLHARVAVQVRVCA
jgi:hypothetical protein